MELCETMSLMASATIVQYFQRVSCIAIYVDIHAKTVRYVQSSKGAPNPRSPSKERPVANTSAKRIKGSQWQLVISLAMM